MVDIAVIRTMLSEPALAGAVRGWPIVTGQRAGAWPVAGLAAGAGGAAVVDGAEVAEEPGLAGAGFFAVTPERRKARAGDDGESGGGSGISHAKAAGGTDDASGAGADEPESDERGPDDVVADDPGPDVVPTAGPDPADPAGSLGLPPREVP